MAAVLNAVRRVDVGDTAQFAAGLLMPNAPVPALFKGKVERRYAVYSNNVTVGLVRALEANVPAIRKLLGEAYFAGFAREHAQAHPPQSPLMFTYGSAFPEALATAEYLASFGYLADVARLEILWRQSYHAADAAVLASEHLSSVDPEALFDCQIIAHPALRLLKSNFAVHDIFMANRTEPAVTTFDPYVPQSVMLSRPALEVQLALLNHSQYIFLAALTDGQSLGLATDSAVNADAAFDLSATLALLLQSGSFHSLNLGTEQHT
jgi:hypothetical protein